MAYHKSKKECQKACRESYNSCLSSLLDDSTKCVKEFWAFVKSRKKDQFGITALNIRAKYTLTVCPRLIYLITNLLVFTRKDVSHIPKMCGNQVPDIPDVDIQIEGVTKLLQQLDSHKATGPDSIPAYLLKQTALQIAPVLALIP